MEGLQNILLDLIETWLGSILGKFIFKSFLNFGSEFHELERVVDHLLLFVLWTHYLTFQNLDQNLGFYVFNFLFRHKIFGNFRLKRFQVVICDV